MRARRSLRLKVALVFSALAILLLLAQALGVKTLAETQEEKFIAALIADDMGTLQQTWRNDPTLLPPFDARVGGRVAEEGRAHVLLPASVAKLGDGTHEIIVDGREIHVAVAPFGAARVYRVYDFNTYERHFKRAINALMVVTGLFALLTIWLAFGLSGLLVRQVAGFARQVKALRLAPSESLNPGRYDEAEVVELVEAFNDYHHRMARMIEREKDFTGNVSHELRTPLTAIKTSCELLDQDGAISPKSRERLHRIERATERMIELVGALLLLAREESPAETAPVHLSAAVAEVLEPFATVMGDKGVAAQVAIDSRLQVEANRSALVIVLSNLIDNAVRHTERGYIRVSHLDGWLRIEDSGSGIPADALPHVFDRFYRADAVPAAGRGFGIGLAIVKKICDRHRWPITLDSDVGKGTSVRLRLPPAGSDIPGFTKN